MTDITKRLRDYDAQDTDAIMDEAADEIERLRGALQEIVDDVDLSEGRGRYPIEGALIMRAAAALAGEAEK